MPANHFVLAADAVKVINQLGVSPGSAKSANTNKAANKSKMNY